MPVLNEAAQIVERLTALQALRKQGVELIVVDGGSEDNTVSLVGSLADRMIASKRGRAVQMNAGVRVSHGKTLLFLHADTSLPEASATVLREAIADGAIWGRFDIRIDGSNPLLWLVGHLMNWRSRLSGIATGDQAIFVRRKVFEAIGGYGNIPLMEDIALSTKLKTIAPPTCLSATVITSGRRWEKNGVIRTILLMWSLRAAYFFGADPHRLAQRYGYRPHQS